MWEPAWNPNAATDPYAAQGYTHEFTTALVKAVRASCRTFQLFEITKAVLEKNDRFVVVIQRKAGEKQSAESTAEGAEAAKAAGIQ